jgi:hypothetical protein
VEYRFEDPILKELLLVHQENAGKIADEQYNAA